MLSTLKFYVFTKVARLTWGKNATVFWGYTQNGVLGFFIARNLKDMDDCIKILNPHLQDQLKRKPAKVLPFRRRREETEDEDV